MSEWQAIENAIVQALGDMTDSGRHLGLAVRGRTARDRKLLVADLLRERMPAAYVTLPGRDASDKEFSRPGAVQVCVLYADRSERGDDEARHGGPDVAGVMRIARAAATALQDLDLGERRRLLLLDERCVGGEAGTAMWEQRYAVRRMSGDYAPTFGGIALVGQLSEVQVHVGDIKRASSSFAFPGVDGVFERFGGTRERSILWRGQLRATDNFALNAVEEGIEQRVIEASPNSMSDAWARTFENCVVRSFKRIGSRSRDDLTGEALQAFEIEFIQLAR